MAVNNEVSTPIGTEDPRRTGVGWPLRIEAEAEDSSTFGWDFFVFPQVSFSKVVAEWASLHCVPCDAVGLEGTDGTELDTRKTPEEMGWAPARQTAEPTVLCAFPAQDDSMEKLRPEKLDVLPPQKTLVASSRTAGAANAKPRDVTVDTAEASGAPPSKRARTGGEEDEAKASKFAEVQVAEDKTVARAVEGRAKAADDKTTSAKVASAKKAETNANAEPKPTPTLTQDPPASAKAAGKAKAAKPTAKVKVGMKDLGEDVKIEYKQSNPKKTGGSAFDRYEKYKAAKTVKQAQDFGASKGDIKYDMDKGFCKFVD